MRVHGESGAEACSSALHAAPAQGEPRAGSVAAGAHAARGARAAGVHAGGEGMTRRFFRPPVKGGSERRERGVRFSRKPTPRRSEEHTSELQSPCNLVCRLLLEKKKKK